ncbi:MAG: hypothetical protein K0B10_00840 [Vicingaceae bacterium]|nr:hypothetical protein [Vicingaceae bacterium]
MKVTKNIMLLAIFLIGAITFQSCSKSNKDNANTVTEQLKNNLQQGTWNITYFEKNGIDSTTYLSNYNFSFEANNIVLCRDTANHIYNGTWSIRRIPSGDEDEDEDEEENGVFIPVGNTVTSIDNLEIVINFNYLINLKQVNNKWKLLNQRPTIIELKNYNGFNIVDTYLTLEKN